MYFPRSSVIREQINQIKRRTLIESKNQAAIATVKEKLRNYESVEIDLAAIGLTKKHSKQLISRLLGEIQNEERKKALKEVKEERKNKN